MHVSPDVKIIIPELSLVVLVGPSGALAELQVGPARVLSLTGAYDCCFGPGGQTLMALPADHHGVMVLDLQQPDAPKLVSEYLNTASLSLSPDGRWFATGNWRGTNVTVWDLATAQPIKQLVVRGNAMVLFSPDGQCVATASDEEYRLWKAGSWEPGLAMPRNPPSALLGHMAFSPDGRILAVLQGRNSEVKLIAVPSGNELATLDTGPPLCFSGDGSMLATAGEDLHSAFVWDLRRIRQRLAALHLDW